MLPIPRKKDFLDERSPFHSNRPEEQVLPFDCPSCGHPTSMGRGSDRSLIGKVMTNYMECPMRGEGWSLEIDVPPHAMLIPVWDE